MAEKKKKNDASSDGSASKKTGKTSSASNSTKKKNAAAANSSTEVKKSLSPPKRKNQLLRDRIWSIIIICVGIFMAVSIQTDTTGQFGQILQSVLKGCFGLAAYILPYYLIIYGLLLITKQMAHINGVTVFLLFIIFLCITVYNASRFIMTYDLKMSLTFLQDSYAKGITLEGGGAVGMTIAYALHKLIGITGLYLSCSAVLIICVIMVADTPLSKFFERRKQKKFEKIENDYYEDEDEEYDNILNNINFEKNAPEENMKKKRHLFGRKNKKELDDSNREDVNNNKNDGNNEYDGWNSQEEGYSTLNGFYGDDGTLSQRDNQPERQKGDIASKSIGAAAIFGENGYKSPFERKKQIFDYVKDEDGMGFPSYSQEDDSPYKSGYGLEESDMGFGMEPESNEDEYGLEEFEDLADYDYDHNRAESGKKAETDTFNTGLQNDFLNSESPEGNDYKNEADFGQGDNKKKDGKSFEQTSEVIDPVGSGLSIANAREKERKYRLPPISLLKKVRSTVTRGEEMALKVEASKLEAVLHDFGVNARVVDVRKGPSVTRYEIQPATGVKVSSIVRLSDDIALNLRAKSIRIEAPIPGKAAVGIEVQNESSTMVSLREMISSQEFNDAESKISFVVGKDISGGCVVSDLKSMPHLLIAGSTGSGKSVCINSILMSILYKANPNEVKLVLVDPKVVELGNYNGIPHMLIPVVTDPSKAAAALGWAVQEMNDRYKKYAEIGARDLASYNEKVRRDNPELIMPQIVIIIDELADLMMAAPRQVEENICRLAQMARAAGMHLILATQRPSVDIITGVIKANIPSRIAFAVSSGVDSRTILDMVGAEKLVGKGDMLFSPLGMTKPLRLQGPFVSDEEVNSVIDFWKAQGGSAEYAEDVINHIENSNLDNGKSVDDNNSQEDELLNDAIEVVVSAQQASASMLQRRFRIGYNRAARLIDIMEDRKIIGPSEGSKPRKVLLSKENLAMMPESANGDENEDIH